MLFYHVARHDGLEKLEMDPLYLIQNFQDRLDLLYCRKVDYQPRSQGQVDELKRNVLVRNEIQLCVCVLNSLYHHRPGKRGTGRRGIVQHFSQLHVT